MKVTPFNKVREMMRRRGVIHEERCQCSADEGETVICTGVGNFKALCVEGKNDLQRKTEED